MSAGTELVRRRYSTQSHVTQLDLALGALLATAAMTVYLLTLFPGLGGGGDSAKFQYLGAVLGTAHPPGYPGYVLISHVFSYLPFGSLAHRINVMSAMFATLACVMTYLILRRLSCDRVVAVSTALAMAFGRILWSKAVVAEVYALNAAFASAILFAIVCWSDSRRTRALHAAIALACLALGNHLTIVMLAPALIVYALLVDWRTAWRPATVITTVVLLVLGLGQYLFIIIRTWQGAPYLEARAANLTELVDVIRASKYGYQMFPFSASELLSVRVPRIAMLWIREFGPVGTLLFVGGVVVGARWRPKETCLFLLGGLGVAFLTVNVDADIEGFMLAGLVAAWPLVGLGFQAVRTWMASRRGYRRSAGALTLALALAMPTLQVRANYRANDHHRRTFEIRYFDALFASLEDKAALVSESYAVDQLVLYKLAGERAAGSRTIELIPSDADTVLGYWRRGYAIYAFPKGRARLQNLGASVRPVRLDRPPSSASDAQKALASDVTDSDMRALPLYRVVAAAECEEVGNTGWRDVLREGMSGQWLGRIDNYRPFSAEMLFYLASASPLVPRLVLAQGAGDPALAATCAGRGGPDGDRLRQLMASDGIDPARVPGAAEFVCRGRIAVNDGGEFSGFAIDLGGVPLWALARARVDLDNPRRATVCSLGVDPSGIFGEDRPRRITIEMGEPTGVLLGRGWHEAERGPHGTFRWMSRTRGEIGAVFREPEALTIHVAAHGLAANESVPTDLGLSVNGRSLSTQRMRPGWVQYRWDAPASLWRAGLNVIGVHVSALRQPAALGLGGDTRALGAAVSEIVLERSDLPRP